MEENSKFAEGEVTRFFNETFIRTKTENSIPLGSSIFRNLLLRNTDQFANQNTQLYPQQVELPTPILNYLVQ